jgi:hypothetical protein
MLQDPTLMDGKIVWRAQGVPLTSFFVLKLTEKLAQVSDDCNRYGGDFSVTVTLSAWNLLCCSCWYLCLQQTRRV